MGRYSYFLAKIDVEAKLIAIAAAVFILIALLSPVIGFLTQGILGLIVTGLSSIILLAIGGGLAITALKKVIVAHKS